MYTLEALQFDGITWLDVFKDRRYFTYNEAHDVMISRGGYKRRTVKYRILRVK